MQVDRHLFVGLIGFLWRHAPQRLKYLLVALALVAGLTRDLVMVVINQAAGSTAEVALQTWLPVFLVILTLFVGASLVYQIMTTAVTTEVVNRVRLGLVEKITNVQPMVVSGYERGTLYHIMTTDVAIVAGTTSTLLSLLPLIVFLFIAIPQLFFYSVVAGLLAVLVMVGGVLVYWRQQQAMVNIGVDARKLEVAYFEAVSELLDGHRELKLNRARRLGFVSAMAGNLARLRRALIAVSRIYEQGEAGVSLLKFGLLSGIVFLAPALYAVDSRVTFSVLTLVLFCMNPFEQLVSSYPTIIGTMVSFVRIRELDSTLQDAANEGARPAIAQPFRSLSLQGVTVTHRQQAGQGFALGPIDLEIARGDILFVVGENGSGKTTLLHLIAGLHDPASGQMVLNGQPVGQDGTAGLRAGVSAIFAQYHIFQTLFGLDVGDAVADAAIARVNLAGQTQVVNGAVTRLALSAGQKRRLALAIALLEDRDILILDEFAADQDPNQRAWLFEQLFPELKRLGKTVILATHDLSWNHLCDRLIRLEGGRIISQSRPATEVRATG
jgi:putative pyoverdin transport system ATP-binding/permease protein